MCMTRTSLLLLSHPILTQPTTTHYFRTCGSIGTGPTTSATLFWSPRLDTWLRSILVTSKSRTKLSRQLRRGTTLRCVSSSQRTSIMTRSAGMHSGCKKWRGGARSWTSSPTKSQTNPPHAPTVSCKTPCMLPLVNWISVAGRRLATQTIMLRGRSSTKKRELRANHFSSRVTLSKSAARPTSPLTVAIIRELLTNQSYSLWRSFRQTRYCLVGAKTQCRIWGSLITSKSIIEWSRPNSISVSQW